MNATLEVSSQSVQKDDRSTSAKKNNLISWISKNDQVTVDRLLKNGSDPNYFYDNQWTPLKYAIVHDKVWEAKMLLKNGADPNFYDQAKWTPLTCAINYDKGWAVRLLLEQGADPNLFDGEYTPLKYAIKHGKVYATDLLLKNGADPKLRHAGSSDAIKYAIDCGEEWAVSLLKKRISLNLINDEQSLLIYAIEHDKKSFVDLLLSEGANPNFDHEKLNPLRYSISAGKEWAVKLLLKHGADSNFCGKKNCGPITYAIDSDKEWAVKILLKHGANPNFCDKGNWTPLTYAISKDKEWAVKLLLEHKADIDFYDKSKWTPLKWAIFIGKEWVVKLLIDKGANLNLFDPKSQTPLRCAILYDREWAAKLLLDHKVDPNSQEKDGLTPLRYAISKGKEWAVKLLLENGADPNFCDQCNWTPLTCAISTDKERIVKLLLEYGANINLFTDESSPPLTFSIYNNKEWAAKLVIGYGANIRLYDKSFCEPMACAIRDNVEWAIRLLLEHDRSLASPYNFISYTFGDYFPTWERVWKELGDDIDGGQEKNIAGLLNLMLCGQFTLEEGWRQNFRKIGMSEVDQQLCESFNHFLCITNSSDKSFFSPISYASFVLSQEHRKQEESKPYFHAVVLEVSKISSHVVSIGFWKEWVIFCDRGGRVPWANDEKTQVFGVIIRRLKQNSSFNDIAGKIKSLKNEKDWEILKKDDTFIEEESLVMLPQFSGSCPLTSPKTALYGLLFLQAREHGLSRERAHAFYKQWAFWDRQDMLKKYLSLKRVRTVLCWGLGEEKVKKLQDKLDSTSSPKEVLDALSSLNKELAMVPYQVFYKATDEAFKKGLFGLCKDASKIHTNINRILTSMPSMIRDLQAYYERESKEGNLAELRWAANGANQPSHQLN